MKSKSEFTRQLPYVAVYIVLAAMLPAVLNDFYLTIACFGMLYAIVALGLNFIVGMSGLMTLGTGAVYGMGAYTSALLCTRLGVNPWLALIPVLLMGWLIGQCLGYPSLRVQGVYLSLATIGFNEIIRLLITNLQFTGSGTGVRNIPPYSIFGFRFDSQRKSYFLILFVLLISIIIALRIVYSKWGRAFKAVKDNPEALDICGVNIARVKVTAFTLSSVFGCAAGAMYAHLNRYIAPTTFTTDLSITFVVILIVGGLGSFWGCIFGAYVVAFLPQVLRGIGITYKLVYAVIIMLLVVFFPGGIVQSLFRMISTRMKGSKNRDE